MHKILPLALLFLGCAGLLPATALATTPANSQQPSKFVFKDASGKPTSVDVVDKYQPKKIVRPFAKIDGKLDPKLMHAATIAEERAHAHSRRQCWHYVKEALLAAGGTTPMALAAAPAALLQADEAEDDPRPGRARGQTGRSQDAGAASGSQGASTSAAGAGAGHGIGRRVPRRMPQSRERQ